MKAHERLLGRLEAARAHLHVLVGLGLFRWRAATAHDEVAEGILILLLFFRSLSEHWFSVLLESFSRKRTAVFSVDDSHPIASPFHSPACSGVHDSEIAADDVGSANSLDDGASGGAGSVYEQFRHLNFHRI